MLQLPVDVQPPTTVIWTNLLHIYLFLGFSAGTVVTAWLMYNVFTNRASKVKTAPKFHEEESGWGNWKTVLYTLMVTGTVLGFVEYETFASSNLITIPNGDPITINVMGQQFLWKFTYSNGYTTNSRSPQGLVVPQDEVVVLNITSKDVDHSFSIATLDVAKDALPGEYNTLWFNATQLGTFVNDIRCKELCGVGHATMTGNLTVMTQSSFNSWLASNTPAATTTTSTGTPTGPVQVITIPVGVGSNPGLNFEPASVTVTSGTTIKWVNNDITSTHNIYFTSVPTGASVSPNPSPDTTSWSGNTFSVTLTTPGVYAYECQYHSGWMHGTITVTG